MSTPTFTQKHYRAIASMLLDAKQMSTIEDVAMFFCVRFQQDNPKFNSALFLRACGMDYMIKE